LAEHGSPRRGGLSRFAQAGLGICTHYPPPVSSGSGRIHFLTDQSPPNGGALHVTWPEPFLRTATAISTPHSFQGAANPGEPGLQGASPGRWIDDV